MLNNKRLRETNDGTDPHLNQREPKRGLSSNPENPGPVGDFAVRQDTFNYPQGATPESTSKGISLIPNDKTIRAPHRTKDSERPRKKRKRSKTNKRR